MANPDAPAAPSPSLTNSQRRLYKASYRPLTVPAEKQPQTGRFLEKLAFVRGLDIQPGEAAKLKNNGGKQGEPGVPAQKSTQAPGYGLIEAINGLAADLSFAAMQHFGPPLARTSSDALLALGSALAEMRRSAAADARNVLHEIQSRYARTLHKRTRRGSASIARKTPQDAIAWAEAEEPALYMRLRDFASNLPPSVSPARSGTGMAGRTVTGNEAGPTLPEISPADISDIPRILEQRASLAANLANAFQYQGQHEPVGQLHLERLEMTPAGIEHGELVHSVPLTPKETINITHREWSVTTTTFENIVQDSFEGFSETGVTEKTDLSQATDNETKHSSALDVNGSVSASYNGGAYSVTASSAVDYRQQTDTQQIEKDSIAHSLAITRNASTRTKKDHKVSFRVSSVAGAEDLAVQVLTNPSDINAMRVDYFQLLRKWRVDLIRYGLRMTYDIVIPNPGLDLIGRVLEIQAIDEMLTTAAYSFNINITDVTPAKWLDLSQQYGVELDPPPQDPVEQMQTGTLQESIDKFTFGSIEYDLPDGYIVTAGSFRAQVHIGDADFNSGHRAQISVTGEAAGPLSSPRDSAGQFLQKDGILDVVLTNGSIVNRTGKVSLRYQYYNVESGGFTASITARPTEKTVEAWQLKSWTALRDADQAGYDKTIDRASARKAYLQAEIDRFDALTLRKMEREEIMRWVLRWLLGPGFDLMPASLKGLFTAYPSPPEKSIEFVYPDVSSLGLSAWENILDYGDFIRYIHDAIEWENVLFFAYPYFWDTAKNWPFKRFLMHPDAIHREFLRSGAMRVVLTIRPGFEESFAMLQQTGDSTAPPDASFPYVTIAEDIRNFAMTNYEGIPPANPDNNVRPLLYPEQRKAWGDMQKLIQVLEDYNDAQHRRTITDAVILAPAGQPTSLAVSPSSMDGIAYGMLLIVDPQPPSSANANLQETVVVTDTTATTFTAVFTRDHAAGAAVQLDPAVPMYPATVQFPAAIQAFAGNAPLPLTDPWGHPYHYLSPGLNADYDLVSYGADGVAQKDQTDPAKLADPLNADITSYAEGSVVGRWYEYTPTGALDVSINTVLPTTPQAA